MTVREWQVWGTIVRWIDGDTLVAHLDLGWGVWHHGHKGKGHHIRLVNVDTPERGQPGFEEAKAVAEAEFPPGSAVLVRSTKIDSFGRILGEISKEE